MKFIGSFCRDDFSCQSPLLLKERSPGVRHLQQPYSIAAFQTCSEVVTMTPSYKPPKPPFVDVVGIFMDFPHV